MRNYQNIKSSKIAVNRIGTGCQKRQNLTGMKTAEYADKILL